MLSEKVIHYCKSKNWWFEDTLVEYEQALIKLGIDLGSDFAMFYLHAEDGPTFFSRRREIYQICWLITNVNQFMYINALLNVYKITHLLELNDFSNDMNFRRL